MSRADNTRFDTWQEIAAYLQKDVRTARRWEHERGLPVRRAPGGKHGAVFAYRSEIDAWLASGSHHDRHEGQSEAEIFDNQDHPDEQTEGVRQSEAILNGPGSQQVVSSPHKSSNSKRDERTHDTVSDGSFGKAKRPSMLLYSTVILGLVVIVAGLALALMFLRAKIPHTEVSYSGLPSIVPPRIEHWLRVSLVNDLPTAVRGPFQQLVTVNSSLYSANEASNLRNIAFFDSGGKILASWLESGNSNLSQRSVYWIQLPEGMPASKVVNIYMGFAAKETNLFDGKNTGEAPGLSPTYGQYDNGGNVFPHYANFAENSLPPGWYSGFTEPGHGEVRVNNGVLLGHNGRGGGTVFLGSDWSVKHNITEMDLLSEHTEEGQIMILVCSASPTHYRWTPNSIGFQNTSGLEIERNNSGTPAILATATLNPTLPSVIGFQERTLFVDYQPVVQIDSQICGGEYLAMSANTGRMAAFSFDWIRMRVPPPNGVMPIVIFGELN